MKRKSTTVIGMVVCFTMIATFAWALPGVPNGTVTDSSTGLVWLQNANCFGKQNLVQAMRSAASLKSGSCGLTDGSTAGQWRLPTKDELAGRLRNLQGFSNVQADGYWPPSSHPGKKDDHDKAYGYYVWPVRAGQ